MKSSINLTFIGGVDEVGGNVVFLEDFVYDVNMFIDFGIKIGDYYNIYERGDHSASIDELVNLGLIPGRQTLSIHNIYTKELSRIDFKDKSGEKSEFESVDYLSPSNLY